MRYLKNMEKEIIIDNKLDEIAKIAQFIEELGMSLQLPSEITMSINLAIEEAIQILSDMLTLLENPVKSLYGLMQNRTLSFSKL